MRKDCETTPWCAMPYKSVHFQAASFQCAVCKASPHSHYMKKLEGRYKGFKARVSLLFKGTGKTHF